jgi:hypothetical protein
MRLGMKLVVEVAQQDSGQVPALPRQKKSGAIASWLRSYAWTTGALILSA